jgi:RNA chaperone Hfq
MKILGQIASVSSAGVAAGVDRPARIKRAVRRAKGSEQQVSVNAKTLSLYKDDTIPSGTRIQQKSIEDTSMAQDTTLAHEFRSEEQFLEALVHAGHHVSVYLVNGVKLSGRLVNALEHCILVRTNDAPASLGNTQMVFKTAISSVVPGAGGRGEVRGPKFPSRSHENLGAEVY